MSKPLYAHLSRLSEAVTDAAHLLLGLDFDGTLSPIADNPEHVEMPAQTRQTILALARRPDTTVAILSGRERSDLAARVRIPNVVYSGNHGLEISGPGFIFIEPAAAAGHETLRALAQKLTSRLRYLPGVFLEDKGLTLSVHYRQAPAAAEEIRHVLDAALKAAASPFGAIQGNMVFEIRPRIDWNKSSALRWIKDQYLKKDCLTLYLGDDVSEDESFDQLPDAITIKVGPGPDASAQYRVESPDEVRHFLQWLVDRRSLQTA
jgi:trehalose 6-phosphate phosphatase